MEFYYDGEISNEWIFSSIYSNIDPTKKKMLDHYGWKYNYPLFRYQKKHYGLTVVVIHALTKTDLFDFLCELETDFYSMDLC